MTAPLQTLVLGGTGFLGRHIVTRLRREGHGVRTLARGGSGPDHIAGDWRDPMALARALDGVEVAVHVVGGTSPRSSNADMPGDVHANLLPWLTFLDACRRASVRRVVFASSGGTVYGPTPAERIDEDTENLPSCSYGIVKLAMEKYLHLQHHLHGLEYATLRVANPYGEHQSHRGDQGVVAIFSHRIATGQPLTLFGNGAAVRDYLYAGDVADAFARAATSPLPACVCNVGSGDGLSLNRLVGMLEGVVGRKAVIVRQPGRALDVPRVVLDNARAKDLLGWEPTTTLDDGLRRAWAWLKPQCEASVAAAG